MSRIDPGLVLPVFHDRVPTRGAGDFLAQLQAGVVAQAPLSQATPASAAPVVANASPEQGPDELYELGRVAAHHLSYLAPAGAGAAGPQAGPLTVTPETSATVQAGLAIQRGQSPLEGVASAGPALPPGLPASGGEDVAPEAPEATAGPGGYAGLSSEPWVRKLRLLPAGDGVELVLRDSLPLPAQTLVALLREHSRRQGIAPVRIVLNGHVVWSRTSTLEG